MAADHLSEKMKNVIWPEFRAHFRSAASAASYWSDLCEFAQITGADLTQAREQDVQAYYRIMTERCEGGEIQQGTLAKKFRELHSLADFMCRRTDAYGLPSSFRDLFYPYLPGLAGQDRYADVAPVEEIDRLLEAAQGDRQAYTVITLLYRVGLSSTEICALKREDIGLYENGAYLAPEGRQEGVYVPEDALQVLESYLEDAGEHPTLFYNRRGDPLNPMYISRMLRRYSELAGIPPCSARKLRSACAYNLFSYEAGARQVAAHMGITKTHVNRYRKKAYKEQLSRAAGRLVRIRVEDPFGREEL